MCCISYFKMNFLVVSNVLIMLMVPFSATKATDDKDCEQDDPSKIIEAAEEALDISPEKAVKVTFDSYNTEGYVTICWHEKTLLKFNSNGEKKGYVIHSISFQLTPQSVTPPQHSPNELESYEIVDKSGKKTLQFATVFKNDTITVKENNTFTCKDGQKYSKIFTQLASKRKIEIKLMSPLSKFALRSDDSQKQTMAAARAFGEESPSPTKDSYESVTDISDTDNIENNSTTPGTYESENTSPSEFIEMEKNLSITTEASSEIPATTGMESENTTPQTLDISNFENSSISDLTTPELPISTTTTESLTGESQNTTTPHTASERPPSTAASTLSDEADLQKLPLQVGSELKTETLKDSLDQGDQASETTVQTNPDVSVNSRIFMTNAEVEEHTIPPSFTETVGQFENETTLTQNKVSVNSTGFETNTEPIYPATEYPNINSGVSAVLSISDRPIQRETASAMFPSSKYNFAERLINDAKKVEMEKTKIKKQFQKLKGDSKFMDQIFSQHGRKFQQRFGVSREEEFNGRTREYTPPYGNSYSYEDYGDPEGQTNLEYEEVYEDPVWFADYGQPQKHLLPPSDLSGRAEQSDVNVFGDSQRYHSNRHRIGHRTHSQDADFLLKHFNKNALQNAVDIRLSILSVHCEGNGRMSVKVRLNIVRESGETDHLDKDITINLQEDDNENAGDLDSLVRSYFRKMLIKHGHNCPPARASTPESPLYNKPSYRHRSQYDDAQSQLLGTLYKGKDGKYYVVPLPEKTHKVHARTQTSDPPQEHSESPLLQRFFYGVQSTIKRLIP